MLKETSGDGFKIGDTVMICSAKQIGTIVACVDGRWKVKIANGVEILKESKELQRRQILLG